MTQEIYEKLCGELRQHIYTAYYCSFIRLTDHKQREAYEEIYKEVFGVGGNILGGCNRCVLNALRKLGEEYFKYEKEMKRKEEEAKAVEKQLEPKTETPETEVVTKPAKKSATKTATNKAKTATKKTKKQ